MANTLSAKKRVRASLRKRTRNRATRSQVKTLVARARHTSGTPDASLTSADVRQAVRALDKAAEKGVLHPNNAARRKARLMHALAKAGAVSRSAGAPAAPSRKPAAPPKKGTR
ncbi:MAG TPA: 30S ribosomal protein S20 [Candidatus Sulfotelmatobacter sp.]|nr:30S ribosomal protein S20 [Candidatus Sulfotelmatobacter sp.]